VRRKARRNLNSLGFLCFLNEKDIIFPTYNEKSAENEVSSQTEGCLGSIKFTSRFLLLGYESGNIKTFSIDEKFQLLSVTNITHSVVCLDYDYKAGTVYIL
jgi:hypothetical protein